jgi:ketosteroid isomerase-like protein
MAGCAPETTLKSPPAPVNWTSLDQRSAAQETQSTSPTELELRVAPAYMKALATHDGTGLSALIDEHAHFSFAGMEDVNGREGVVQAQQAALSAFDNRSFTVTRVFVSDDAQAVEWTMSATHHATQKTIVLEGVALLWTRDSGAIKDVHFYYDQGFVNALLGVEPKPSAQPRAVSMPSADQNQVFVAASSKEEAGNRLTVQSWLDSLEDNEERAYLSKMSDTVEIVTDTSILKDKAAQRTYFTTIRAALMDLNIQLDSIWSVGPYVITEYHLAGEQNGALGWIPAQKDTLVRLFTVDICELRSGRITHIRRYDNPMQVLASTREDT